MSHSPRLFAITAAFVLLGASCTNAPSNIVSTPITLDGTPAPVVQPLPAAPPTPPPPAGRTETRSVTGTAGPVRVQAEETITTSCATTDCFQRAFATCTPGVALTADLGFASYHYRIVGPKNGGCAMTTSYPTNPNPAWVGKAMTCTYNNRGSFEDAAQAMFNNLSSCTGPLADILRGTTDQSTHAPTAPPADAPQPTPATPANDRTSVREQEAIITMTFVNAITGKPVPGHAVTCYGCGGPQWTDAETDLQGTVSLPGPASDRTRVATKRIDWHNHGDVLVAAAERPIVVRMQPQAVDAGQRIFFPHTTFTRNTRTSITYALTITDRNGSPMARTAVTATGPMKNGVRTTAIGVTDANGHAVIPLPLNGAYRIHIPPGDFFQFDAPTGYDVSIDLDLSNLDAVPSGTAALSKSYRERGMILVCARDQQTNEPVFSTVVIPGTSTTITRSVRHDGDICVEVPQGYQEVMITPTDTHKGHEAIATSRANADGILILTLKRNE